MNDYVVLWRMDYNNRFWITPQLQSQSIIIITIEMDMIKDQLEVVWAKIKGYSWWPATMRNSCRGTSTSDQKIRVQFFGETSHSFVTSKMIADFRAHFKEFSNTRNKKLLRSIRMAEEFEQQLQSAKLDKDTPPTNIEPCSKFQTPRMEEEEPVKNVQLSSINIQQSKSILIDSKESHVPVDETEEADKNINPITIPKKSKFIRKPNKLQSTSSARIPYRKFQDMKFQCKIVDLLNKLKNKKNCDSDLTKLLQRIPKIIGKLQFNRFIISGIAVALKLIKNLQQNNNYQEFSSTECKQLVKDIQEAYNHLIQSIRSEIHATDQIRTQIAEVQIQSSADSSNLSYVEKKNLVKSIYKILREKKFKGRQHCQNISIQICNKLETQTTNNTNYIRSKSAKQLLRRISSSQIQYSSHQDLLQDLTLKIA